MAEASRFTDVSGPACSTAQAMTRGPGGGKWIDDAGPGGVPLFDAENWMSSLNESGCGPGVSIIEMGPPDERVPTVGSGGGYGAIYCFALMP